MPRVLLPAFLFVLLGPTAALGQGSLSGHVYVVEGDDRTPLQGAYVVARAYGRVDVAAAKTDAAGAYILSGLPGQQLTFSVEHRGHFTREAGGTPAESFVRSCPPEDSCGEADFVLSKAAVIEGYVTGPFGNPLSWFNVELRRGNTEEGQSYRRSQPTDDRGYFRFYGLPEGDYTVSARSGDWLERVYEPNSFHVSVGAGETAPPVRLALSAAADPVRVSGMIEGLDLVGDELARIQAVNANGTPWHRPMVNLRVDLSDEDSLRFFGFAPPGEYEFRLSVQDPGRQRPFYEPARQLTLGRHRIDRATAGLRLSARAGATFVGSIRFEDTSEQHTDLSLIPLDGGSLEMARDLRYVRLVRMRENGDPFRRSGLIPGRYRLVLYDDELFIASETEFQLSEGQTVETEVVISGRLAKVTGMVRPAADETGPFLVALRTTDEEVYVTQTDVDGRYSFFRLKPGEYSILAWSDLATPASQDEVWRDSDSSALRFPLAAGDQTEILLTAQP